MKRSPKILIDFSSQRLQSVPGSKAALGSSGDLVIAALFVILSCATMKAQAQDSNLHLSARYEGRQFIDGEIDEESGVRGDASYFAPSGKLSYVKVYGLENKGLRAVSRPGYLHAAVGSSMRYSGESSQPSVYRECGGIATVSFADGLTIRGNGVGSLPTTVRIRVGWRASGSMVFQNQNPAAGVNGGTGYEWIVYSFGVGDTDTTQTGSLGLQAGSTYGGQPSQTVIAAGLFNTTDAAGSAIIGLHALVNVNSHVNPQPDVPLANYCEADTFVTLEVLFIEVVDPATNKHLAVTATSASGHSYPVVQPAVPGVGLGITSMVIDRDIGRGFLSFSSTSSSSYRIKGGVDLGNLQSWTELAVVAGSPGINIVNWNDPEAITQSSRFYVVEKLGE